MCTFFFALRAKVFILDREQECEGCGLNYSSVDFWLEQCCRQGSVRMSAALSPLCWMAVFGHAQEDGGV